MFVTPSIAVQCFLMCLTWFMWITDNCAKLDLSAHSESNMVVFFSRVLTWTEEASLYLKPIIHTCTHFQLGSLFWLIDWSAIFTCQQSLRRHHSCHRPPGNLQDTLCRPPHQIPESAGGSFGLIEHVCANSRSAHPDTPQGIQETE